MRIQMAGSCQGHQETKSIRNIGHGQVERVSRMKFDLDHIRQVRTSTGMKIVVLDKPTVISHRHSVPSTVVCYSRSF